MFDEEGDDVTLVATKTEAIPLRNRANRYSLRPDNMFLATTPSLPVSPGDESFSQRSNRLLQERLKVFGVDTTLLPLPTVMKLQS